MKRQRKKAEEGKKAHIRSNFVTDISISKVKHSLRTELDYFNLNIAICR